VLRLVFGLIETHDPERFLAPLASPGGWLGAVAIPGEPAAWTLICGSLYLAGRMLEANG